MMVYFARIEVAKFRIIAPDLEPSKYWPRRPKRRATFIKIGSSVDPITRIKALQNEYQKPMELLATMPGDRETEKAMHRRFAHLRIEKEAHMPPSEWFHPVAELMDFIRSLRNSEEIPNSGLNLDKSTA